MKTKIYSLLVALMSVVAFSACDDWTPGEQGRYPANTGGVSSANMNVDVNDEVTAIGRAIVDTSDFLVTVYEKGSETVATYDGKACSWTYSAMPEIFTLPVGEYTVSVRSHEPEDAAWSAPYFIGSADFTVKNDEVTYIGTVVCQFASVKVEVRFSQELAEAMESDAKVVVDAGVAGTSLTWTATETRYGYFFPAENNPTILATFTGTVKGQVVSAIKEITDAKFGSYYIFTFSLNTGNPILPDEFGDVTEGTPGITIDFDVIDSPVSSTVRPGETPSGDSDKHPDTEEWPEQPENPDKPDTPDTPDNPDDPKDEVIDIAPEGFDKDGINDITGDTYKMTFKTQYPITNIEVEISSPYLTSNFLYGVGLTSKFDLAYPENSVVINYNADEDPDGKDRNGEVMDLTEALIGFEFPVGKDVIGKTELPFDLSPFIPLLSLDPISGDIHTFRLTIKDNKGNVLTQDLKFQN